MKCFIYTVSNFRPGATECLRHWIECVGFSNPNSDIAVYTDKNSLVIPEFLSGVTILSSDAEHHPVQNKYAFMPSGYDLYVYMDSDILCYANFESVSSVDADLGVVIEHEKGGGKWHSPIHSEMPDQSCALNAGQFFFRSPDHMKLIHEKLQKVYDDYEFENDLHRIAKEQGEFNYQVQCNSHYQKTDYNVFTEMTQLAASTVVKSPTSEILAGGKKVFHFTGSFGVGMNGKSSMMQEFRNTHESELRNYYDLF